MSTATKFHAGADAEGEPKNTFIVAINDSSAEVEPHRGRVRFADDELVET
jgi:hypothetical protein